MVGSHTLALPGRLPHGRQPLTVIDSIFRSCLQAHPLSALDSPTGAPRRHRRSASAMRAKHITLAAILGTIAAACFEGMAPALELGDLQAVPSSHPPYVFHLLIRGSSGDGPDWSSVTVRRPGDVLCLVKNQTVELRLQHLTDVELEISAGGQLLNRLFLKGELQTAQARLTASLAWRRYQTAKAKGQTHSRLAALLNEAYQAHRAWAQLDPRGAQQPFSQAERERQLSLAADLAARQRPCRTAFSPNRSLHLGRRKKPPRRRGWSTARNAPPSRRNLQPGRSGHPLEA